MSAAILSLPSTLELKIPLTDEQFFQLCQENPMLRFERTASGELIIMSLTGGETGNRNIELAFQLQAWSRQNNLGIAFDSSTCFKLPNGANRSPDAAWVQRQRWNSLMPEQRKRFPPLCPDFIVELRSVSDSLQRLQKKMQEYLDNGMRLGWLIDPTTEQVEIYRPSQAVEILQSPTTLLGEAVLPHFVLDVAPVMRIDWCLLGHSSLLRREQMIGPPRLQGFRPNDNPNLLKLRLLQALEKSSGNTFFLGMSSGPEAGADKVKRFPP